MKKFISIVMLASLSLFTTASAVEQCDEWFGKNDFGVLGVMGKSGTGVVLDKNGEMSKIFASGFVRYDMNDAEEIDEALSEASMIAKANITKFIKDSISSDDMVDKISSRKREVTKNGNEENLKVTRQSVKTKTMSIKNHASALLTGVIKVCESNDAATKEIQVVLAVSPKTAAAASKAANMFNKEIGSRKSVEEYAAERQNTDSSNNNSPAMNESGSQSTTNESGSQPANDSFSNKAKNMDF